jgi:hypothetical protein
VVLSKFECFAWNGIPFLSMSVMPHLRLRGYYGCPFVEGMCKSTFSFNVSTCSCLDNWFDASFRPVIVALVAQLTALERLNMFDPCAWLR